MILTGSAFIFFLLTACYRIADASFWLDEAVEYWFSKILSGKPPFSGFPANMYRNILTTYQPPLYNLLMHFWLKLGNSVFWFRFFGVVCGLAGMAGIYKTVRFLSGSSRTAAAAVVFSSCVFRLFYFWQEAAEYCLLAGSLCWTVYFWFRMTDDPSRKNIIRFTISAVIPVYSHYGAVFPSAMMALTAFAALTADKKRRKAVRDLILSYLTAVLFAGVPLYFLFFRKQFLLQQGNTAPPSVLSVFSGNPVKNMYAAASSVLGWVLYPLRSDRLFRVLILCVLLFSVLIFLRGKRTLKLFLIVNYLTFAAYYLAVKSGFYGNGKSGSRYDLFFIPLWITALFMFICEIHEILRAFPYGRIISRVFIGTAVCVCVVFCFMGLKEILAHRWTKENNKTIAEIWFREGGPEKCTFVYYGAAPAFSYYIRQNDAFREDFEENIVYMPWLENQPAESYSEYLRSVYTDPLPPEILLPASHLSKEDDLSDILLAFSDLGYSSRTVYDDYGKLISLTR